MPVIIALIILVVGATALAFDVSILGALLILLGLLFAAVLIRALVEVIISKSKSTKLGDKIGTIIRVASIIFVIIGFGMSIYGCTGDFGVELGGYTDTSGRDVLFLQDKIPTFTYVGIFMIVLGVVTYISLGSVASDSANAVSTKSHSKLSSNNDSKTYQIEYMEQFIELNIKQYELIYEKRLKSSNQKITGGQIAYKDITQVIFSSGLYGGTIKICYGTRSLNIYCTKEDLAVNKFIIELEQNVKLINPAFAVERITSN